MNKYHTLEASGFAKAGKVSVIVGGQFGSEAKGLAGAIIGKFLHEVDPEANLICTTNAGAQAGHTTILEDGSKFVCFHLPTIGVMNPNSLIFLNAGSIIDPVLLEDEICKVAYAVGEPINALRGRIIIHPRAAVITEAHRDIEATATMAIGSTRKGIGASLASKIMRQPLSVARDHLDMLLKIVGRVSDFDLMRHMDTEGVVTMEIPQGTSLSINASPFFPHVTSRDCWVGQGLTDAAIHPKYLGKVMMVCRTFPIRVGNPTDAAGVETGYSGSFYSDSHELKWAEHFPGIEPEITTVTKRVRRIATWSHSQWKRSLELNRPDIVLHTFINYFNEYQQPGYADVVGASHPHNFDRIMASWHRSVTMSSMSILHLFSDGPKVDDWRLDLPGYARGAR